MIFVVDASDKDRFPIVAEVLDSMAKHPNLKEREIPFVICANKQDIADATNEDEIGQLLGVDQLRNIAGNKLSYRIVATTGITGEGVPEALKNYEKR